MSNTPSGGQTAGETVLANAFKPSSDGKVAGGETATPIGETTAARSSSSQTVATLPRLPDFAPTEADGSYRLLGKGGMGAVYLAHQESLDRPVAIKTLSRELAENPTFVERFRREARAMAKINHPNLVQCYAVGEHEGVNYLAMELMKGQSVQDWLEGKGKLSIGDAILVATVAADALGHAHSRKMIHRDIKPDNILVTNEGEIKVADLGLAKAIDEDMSMTQSGHGLGTPHYMPPEQARNAKYVDHRTDIYALGCTLYHMLSGALPFAGDSVVELVVNKEKGSYPSLRSVNKDVPERLSLIVDKMMAKDKDHRYASMADVLKDLDGLKLASQTLSFIDSPSKIAPRRGGPATVASAGQTMADKPKAAAKKSSREDAESSAAASGTGMSKQWFVRLPSQGGEVKLAKATTAQLVARIKSGKLDVAKTTIANSQTGPFLTLAQVPVFQQYLQKEAVNRRAEAKSQNLAEEFKRLDKQYQRRKWWQLLAKFRDGTLGIVSLVIWLAVVAAIIFGAFWGFNEVIKPMIDAKLK